MKSDTIKAITSAAVAIIIVGAGMWQVYSLTQAAIISGDAALAILGPLIGAAAAYVFGQDAATRGARQTESAFQIGAAATTAPTVTTTAGPPPSVTVTPAALPPAPEGD